MPHRSGALVVVACQPGTLWEHYTDGHELLSPEHPLSVVILEAWDGDQARPWLGGQNTGGGDALEEAHPPPSSSRT